jgi:hypothetical protein
MDDRGFRCYEYPITNKEHPKMKGNAIQFWKKAIDLDIGYSLLIIGHSLIVNTL